MSEKVTDIQARHDAAGDGRGMDLGDGWQAHDDRGELLAEIARLRAPATDARTPDDPLHVPAAGCDDCGNDPGQRHGVDCQSLSLAWLGGTREATIAKLPADIAATVDGAPLTPSERAELAERASPATRTFLAAVRAREATVEDFEAVLRAYAAEDRERKAWAAVAPPPEPERPPVARGADEAALDVYIAADAALRGGRFDDVRAMLPGLVGEPLVVMLAGLSITTPCIAEMGAEREALYRAAEQAAGDRAAELLRGLGKDGA